MSQITTTVLFLSFFSFAQLPLVWLPTLWAMTPRQPLQPVDLTTVCPSLCPTCKQTRVAKQVNIMEDSFFPISPIFPVLLEPRVLSSFLFLSFYFFLQPLSNPHVPTTLSVVSQPADEGNGLPGVKRRRVTAEMEGKYIINMPKGTTPRTRRILAQQAKKGRPDPVALSTNAQVMLLLTSTNQYLKFSWTSFIINLNKGTGKGSLFDVHAFLSCFDFFVLTLPTALIINPSVKTHFPLCLTSLLPDCKNIFYSMNALVGSVSENSFKSLVILKWNDPTIKCMSPRAEITIRSSSSKCLIKFKVNSWLK